MMRETIQILAPQKRKLLLPKVTWLYLGIYKYSWYYFIVGFFEGKNCFH